MPVPIVHANIRQRAHLAARHARDTNLAAVADEVDVEGIVAFRRNQLTKNLVNFLIRGLFGDPAEAFRHAKNMRIHGECR